MLCAWCCDHCGTELNPYRSVAVEGLVRQPFGAPGKFSAPCCAFAAMSVAHFLWMAYAAVGCALPVCTSVLATTYGKWLDKKPLDKKMQWSDSFFPFAAVSYVANEICEHSCCGSPKMPARAWAD